MARIVDALEKFVRFVLLTSLGAAATAAAVLLVAIGWVLSSSAAVAESVWS